MNSHGNWAATAACTIYNAYPDNDLLPIEPPRSEETIGEFSARAEDAADTLFLFLCREADDQIDAPEYVRRLDRAIADIHSVRRAFQETFDTHPWCPGADTQDAAIRLSLDGDWIELSLTCVDGGKRSGSIRSSLHTSEDDEEFNAAMHTIESIVLAHVCAGIDVTDSRYVEGLRTCIEACANNLGGDAS